MIPTNSLVHKQFFIDKQSDIGRMITVDHNHLLSVAPKIECFMSSALSVGFCFLAFGCGGDLVPDLPGDPVYDFLPLADPGER